MRMAHGFSKIGELAAKTVTDKPSLEFYYEFNRSQSGTRMGTRTSRYGPPWGSPVLLLCGCALPSVCHLSLSRQRAGMRASGVEKTTVSRGQEYYLKYFIK
jgi:hypothetical protein